MSFSVRAILPNRISGQIAILILVSLIAIHAIITASILWSRGQFGPPSPPARAGELVTVIRMIAAVLHADRAQFMPHIVNAFPGLDIKPGNPVAADNAEVRPDPRIDGLRRHLGPGFQITPVTAAGTNSDGSDILAVRFPDGDTVTARFTRELPPPFFGGPLFMTALFVIVSVTLLALWAARSLTAPLTSFAKAAEGFSPDGDIAPIPERGPVEIRTAAKALNQMRRRIKTLVEDRTRMLAAMGHDLRTPITRMRLRSEYIADETLRGQMLRDLDQMKAMIDAALSYLRDGKNKEEPTRVDVATLLQTVCDQCTDMGHDAIYFGPEHFTMDARADALQRAVGNLVDNAVRYGHKARVRLALVSDAIRIEVEDDGPGIADADKAAMLEPFVRGDASRSMNDSQGFGLGLAIARAVAEAHGGTLTLHDRKPSGLTARIEIARKVDAV